MTPSPSSPAVAFPAGEDRRKPLWQLAFTFTLDGHTYRHKFKTRARDVNEILKDPPTVQGPVSVVRRISGVSLSMRRVED